MVAATTYGEIFVERDIGAPPGVGVEDLVQQIAVAVEDARGLELRGAFLQVIHAGRVEAIE